MRIAILVTHLLGTGHLKRASLIADGFMRAGHEAIVLSGGFPAPNASPDLATLIQLTPIRSDASFKALYGENGEATSDLLAQRRIEIGETLTGFAPDMLVTELFPFGRRKLAAEFEAAIDAVPEALVYCSIRDILQHPRKEGRVAEAETRFANLYDGAFLHGDPSLVPLEDSWALAEPLMSKVTYTGYIAEPFPTSDTSKAPRTVGENEVIVAAGGGSVGDRLFEAAALAGDETWRLLVGGHNKGDRIAKLKALGGKTIIEPTRPDFQTLLSNASLAIVQCGYNTAMDVVQSRVRTIFVPFEGDGETEQITRARAFAERFGCGLLREQDLSATALAAKVQTMLDTPKPDYSAISLRGIGGTIDAAETAMRTSQ